MTCSGRLPDSPNQESHHHRSVYQLAASGLSSAPPVDPVVGRLGRLLWVHLGVISSIVPRPYSHIGIVVSIFSLNCFVSSLAQWLYRSCVLGAGHRQRPFQFSSLGWGFFHFHLLVTGWSSRGFFCFGYFFSGHENICFWKHFWRRQYFYIL